LPRFSPSQKIVVAVVYICGMILNSLDSTIVNVALATLSKEFRVSPTSIQSVVISYLVSIAVFIPTSGWIGDRWGTKKTLLVALTLFTVGSALCGVAQSLDQLVAFRILQGAGGGLLTPVGMAMLYRTFPPEERMAVSRILMFATILGPALGPIIGGVMIEQLSWRWIFYVNVPIGLGALLFGVLFLHEHREQVPGRFDIPGFILAGTGFGAFMYALTEGPARGWTDPYIVSSGIAGVILLTAFVLVELRTEIPMVNLRLLANRLFRSSLLVSLLTASGFIGTLYLVPLFLQEARGASPLQSGLSTFPEAIGVVCSTQIVARLYPRIGPRRLMASGLTFVSAVIFTLGFLQAGSSLWLFRAMMFLLGIGVAYVFLPNQTASMATISSEQTGRASTLYTVQRQLGAAVGIAILSTILAARSSGVDAGTDADAYRLAFIAASGLALLGAIAALFVPDRDAAPTMRRAQRLQIAEEP
jgi:EmrB/QacA subfamily drug resistance transporter